MRAVRRLDEVCDVVMGQAPSGEAYNTDGNGWPLIAGAGDFGEGTPQAKKFTTVASKLTRAGDIVLGIRASIGEKVVADGVYCLGRGVAGLRAHKSSEPRFLWHWLTHYAPRLAAKAKGATFKQVNREDIGGLEIQLPPLAEQRRIAKVLDLVEVLRAKRRNAFAQLNLFTQSLFLNLFGDPMKNEREWRLLKVGLAGRVQLGRQRAPQYQSGKHTRPYVRVANVYEDRLALSNVLSMDFDREDFMAYRLERGDLLLNEGQSTELVGRPAMWRNEIPDCCFQNTLVRFQPNRKATLPEFALALFLHYFRSGEFARISSKTSNVAHLGAGRFAEMPFPLPPIDLQREFARRVRVAEKLKAAHRASLAELDALFATMQHRAFRGEL